MTSFPKRRLFFNLAIIGDARNNFASDRLFKFNTSKTTGHTNSTWHHLSPHQSEGHKDVDNVMVPSQLKMDCLKVAFGNEEKRFLA